jgi:hypothetical protein
MWLAFSTRSPGRVRIWDVNARSEVTNLPALHPSHEPLGVAFSPDSRTLAYNEDENGAILLWDIASRSVIGRLTGHQEFVSALAFSPDGETLASGSHDRTARLWNLAGARPSPGAATDVGQRAQELSRARNDAEPAATEDGRTPLNRYGNLTERQGFAFTNHSGGFTSLAFSPDGRTLAMSGVGGVGRVIRLVDVATGDDKPNCEAISRISPAWPSRRTDKRCSRPAAMAPFASGTLCHARRKSLPTCSLGTQSAPLGALTDLRSVFRRMAGICSPFTPIKPSACGTRCVSPKGNPIRFPSPTHGLQPWLRAAGWPPSPVNAAK